MYVNQLLSFNSVLCIVNVLFSFQILKCFYSLIQFCLSLDLITRDSFAQWMEVTKEILAKPLPAELAQVDPDDLPETIWWKAKKWCLHIMVRTFERLVCILYIYWAHLLLSGFFLHRTA